MPRDVLQALATDRSAYDLILCDPPYGYARRTTASRPYLARALAPDGLLVYETGARESARNPGTFRTYLPHVRLRAPYSVRALMTAIYPGTYDPVTFGHVDVITRAAAIFDRVVVGVVRSPTHKQPTFTIEERVDVLPRSDERRRRTSRSTSSPSSSSISRAAGSAKAIVKGLRAIQDFEWEFQMNQLNRHLAPEIETVYVMASPLYSFISSSGVKEIAAFGGNVDELVPPAVAARFRDLFPKGRGGAPTSPQE